MKIYTVKSTSLPEKLSTRLIKAPNAATAIKFAVSGFYQVKLTSQDELVDLLGKGTKVEEVPAEKAEEGK